MPMITDYVVTLRRGRDAVRVVAAATCPERARAAVLAETGALAEAVLCVSVAP